MHEKEPLGERALVTAVSRQLAEDFQKHLEKEEPVKYLSHPENSDSRPPQIVHFPYLCLLPLAVCLGKSEALIRK